MRINIVKDRSESENEVKLLMHQLTGNFLQFALHLFEILVWFKYVVLH